MAPIRALLSGSLPAKPSLCASAPTNAYFLQDETARVAALHALGILDTAPEDEFDDIALLASAVCGTAAALISFVDSERLWSKAAVGIPGGECLRDISFCHHTIQHEELFMIEDASLDARFKTSPFVRGENGWKFYAGVPLRNEHGFALGALCVLDRSPRTLLPQQKNALRVLAGQVNARLELQAQRRSLEVALRETEAAKLHAELWEKRFQLFMDSGPFIAYIKDADGRLLYYNEPMARKFRVSREAMLNRTDGDLWPAHLASVLREHDLKVLRDGTPLVEYETTADEEGDTSVWRSYKFLCTDTGGKQLLGGISLEVTEELRREEELERSRSALQTANDRLLALASLDALTGLANRRSFDEHMRSAFAQARDKGLPLSLLMMDVDHFKVHNDRFGHAHGDAVLRQLAACFRAQTEPGVLAARYGGEEFVLLLSGRNAAQADSFAKQLLGAVRLGPWPRAAVTISIGISTLNPATRDPQHLIGRADEALYAAKCQGRDRVVSYADDVHRWNLASAAR